MAPRLGLFQGAAVSGAFRCKAQVLGSRVLNSGVQRIRVCRVYALQSAKGTGRGAPRGSLQYYRAAEGTAQ